MKRTRPLSLARFFTFAVLALGLAASNALAATPSPNSAVVKTRIFNDCPTSVLTVVNNYPSLISIDDAQLDCFGFANLHNWRFSENGVDPVNFDNNSYFSFASDLVISGTGNGEAGLQIAVWYSQDVDGRLNVRVPDGEIAAFGGRLPFYSFTASHGLVYVKGTTIGLEIVYRPNDLNEDNPATIEYIVNYNGNEYTSCQIPFDQANPNEEVPHGTWGILNEARVGGFFQPRLVGGDSNNNVRATFTDIEFAAPPFEPVEFKFSPNSINLKAHGAKLKGEFIAEPPNTGADFDVSSIRLNGTVPVDPTRPVKVEGKKLKVEFDREAVIATLPEEGKTAAVIATGTVGGVCFRATDHVKIKRKKVHAPVANAQLNAGSVETVRWDVDTEVVAPTVALLLSVDGGETYTLQATGIANTGSYAWTVPGAVATNQAKLAVVEVESADETGFLVEGLLNESDAFSIVTTAGVGDRALALALRPVSNPTRKLDVTFTLPTGKAATLAAFDVSGRQVAKRDVGVLGAGNHTVRLGDSSTLPAGIYLVRLTQSGVSLKTRAIVVE